MRTAVGGYSGWERRNRDELAQLSFALDATPGWALWPVALPEDEAGARACVSMLSAWWSGERGGALRHLPLDTFDQLVAAPGALASMCGLGAGSRDAFGDVARVGPGRRLSHGDGAIVYHCGEGMARRGEPWPGWHGAMQAFNFLRDPVADRLAAPLLWAGPPTVLAAAWEHAPDLWSVREGRVSLVA